MKKLKKFLNDIFNPENDLDIVAIASALNDTSVRAVWLSGLLEDLKTMNREVDKRLLASHPYGLTDLCSRRKAYQDVLESVLSARRTVMAKDVRPNPEVQTVVNLDRVTA